MSNGEPIQVLGHARSLFGAAVQHTVFGVIQGRWRLLFGAIELLPLELPPPLHDGIQTGPYLRHANCRVYANHVPLPVEDAISWFEAALQGRVAVPNNNGTWPAAVERVCEPEAREVMPNQHGWICATPNRLPFLCGWHGTPRVRHLIAPNFRLQLVPAEDEALAAFLDQEAGFRSDEWRHLLGSIHLIAPNPYFRALNQRLETLPTGQEAIAVGVEPRIGVAVPRMVVDLLDEHRTGVSSARTVVLDGEDEQATMGSAVELASALVRLEQDGSVLEISSPGRFFRGVVSMGFDVGSATREVEVRDGTGQVIEQFTVDVMHPMSSETEPVVDARTAIDVMFAQRELRAAAVRLEQHWFAGDPKVARDFVRGLIARARREVLIADPYLGGVEVSAFARGISLANVPVRLLTTGKAFSMAGAVPATQLKSNVAAWQAQDPSLGEISVRVMREYSLHDRFLRVDDRLYTLGNSLNGLGNKGSLLLRVPDPAPMFCVLNNMWSEALALDDYIVRLRPPTPPQPWTVTNWLKRTCAAKRNWWPKALHRWRRSTP